MLNIALSFAVSLIIPSVAFADKIYTCKEDVSAEISFAKGKLETSAKGPPNSPKSITFVVGAKKATVKNVVSEQYDLKRLGQNVYFNDTHKNMVIWYVFPGSGTTPTYIFLQSSLEVAGPMALEYAYKCQ